MEPEEEMLFRLYGIKGYSTDEEEKDEKKFVSE